MASVPSRVGVKRLFGMEQRVEDGSDDENKPEFELSEEYFEILYRQFIMYMGVSVRFFRIFFIF